jgi:hypothetical protein
MRAKNFSNIQKSPQSLILCGLRGGVGERLPSNERFTRNVRMAFYLQSVKILRSVRHKKLFTTMID